MKYSFCVLFFFFVFAGVAFAHDVFVTEVERPYAIVPIELDIEDKQSHLGTLNDFPVMYEFVVEDNVSFMASLQQSYKESPIPFGLILVRKNDSDGGVTEIMRFNPKLDNWHRFKDKQIGMTFLNSDVVTHKLESGTYRVEVSTPDNIGSYILNIGEYTRNLSYGEKLGNARVIQRHFGNNILNMLTSSLVYYPLGIILLLLVFYKTWQYRKIISTHG